MSPVRNPRPNPFTSIELNRPHPATRTSYARITTLDHNGRRVTARYAIISEGPRFVLARRVDSDGVDNESRIESDGTIVDVQHLISVDCITKRVPLAMSLHYGTLVDCITSEA